jgi:hypothetical protein
MPIPGNLLTTAMAVMPHSNVDEAMEAALSLDIPFWPQLPNLDYHEDMYVQAAEHFPGILLDMEKRTLRFSIDKFVEEYEESLSHDEETDYFDVSEAYSAVYHRFLALDLKDRPAIRGQLEGPVSFGFNVLDQDERPILFDDTVRPFMFEFMAKRINVQLEKLKQKNENAFMFIDEPGMQFIFSALSGYGEQKAKEDLDLFFSMIERPRGIHLCGNPDWDFLLGLDMDILSLDAYSNAEIVASSAPSVKKFLNRGSVLVWGMVPTGFETFEKENLDLLAFRLNTIWKALGKKGVDMDQLVRQSLLSPATCCLVNPDKGKTVLQAFQLTRKLSSNLRSHYKIS